MHKVTIKVTNDGTIITEDLTIKLQMINNNGTIITEDLTIKVTNDQ